MSALSADNLTIGYGAKAVARNINLSLRFGEATCLLGPNGVGKTTLFRTLLGLIPPLDGDVRLAGNILSSLSRQTIASHIAYVPQGYTPTLAYDVLDLVLLGRTVHLPPFGSPRKEDADIARMALDAMGIADVADRNIQRISGGQLQLAYIARALAQQARIIIMDEPSANLDLANSNLVLTKVRALARDGFAVLFSTHDPEQAFAVADHAAIFDREGFLVGEVGTMLTSERLSGLYGVDLLVECTPTGRTVVGPPARLA